MSYLPDAPSGGFFLSKADRQIAKALEQIDSGQMIAMRRDQARLDRVAGTAERGMVRAAQLGALEASLSHVGPNAADYVHACAVGGALGLAAVVNEAARGL